MELQERYKLQTKELKDAVSQRKAAMLEFAEINDRLSEMRTAKQGLSRQVRSSAGGYAVFCDNCGRLKES